MATAKPINDCVVFRVGAQHLITCEPPTDTAPVGFGCGIASMSAPVYYRGFLIA
ncbi:hypothetical protein J6590_070425 [Homalodisca vitripennis]|nr:hypothetical protein J6590_070425 [Homalodisca vitripennis]